MDIKQSLSQNAFFAGLAPKAIDFLAEHVAPRQVHKDQVLFQHGEPASHFYLVCSGTISVEVPAIEGPTLELQKLGPAAIVGWSWMIPPYRWHFQARADSATEVLEFDGRAILAHCEQEPTFGFQLMKRFSTLMSERLEFARKRMMDEWRPSGFA